MSDRPSATRLCCWATRWVSEFFRVGVISVLGRDIVSIISSRRMPLSITAIRAPRMFDLQGRVIVINTALDLPADIGSIGIGFTMPINDMKLIIDRYLRNGKVVIGFHRRARAQRMTPELAAAFDVAKAAARWEPTSCRAEPQRVSCFPAISWRWLANRTQRIPPRLRGLSSRRTRTTYPVRFLRNGTEQTVTIGREEIDPLKKPWPFRQPRLPMLSGS